MALTKERIPLQVIEGRLVLTSVIECESLRIHRQIMDFIIDTGSPDSYFSQKDTVRLQIPVKGKPSFGEVDFGGSRFEQIRLPKFKLYLLKECKEKHEYLETYAELSALKTTKASEKKIIIAQQLPSILGMDFLKQRKLSLHVILTEDIAYLQYEG